jgi:drug/metabolite transporter (DMT)-like permease
MSPFDLFLLVVLGAIWGASFLFIRIGAPALGPVPLVELRLIVAAAVLLGLSAFRRDAVLRPGRWRQFLAQGTVNNVIPFVTIASAELFITAGLGAILNATTPFFTVIVNAVWNRRRPSFGQVLGTVIGFFGVVVLVGIGSLDLGRGVLLGVGLSLVGAFSYGIAAVYASRTFKDLRPIEVSVNQLVVSGVLLAPFAVATRTDAGARPDVIVSVLALAVLGTAVGYLIYFRLIQSAGPTRASTVTLLIPPFGVFFGNVVLGEPIGAGLVAGLVLILAGIALVYGWVRAPRLSFRAATTSD